MSAATFLVVGYLLFLLNSVPAFSDYYRIQCMGVRGFRGSVGFLFCLENRVLAPFFMVRGEEGHQTKGFGISKRHQR